jgi:hypothetical protein
LCGWPIVLTLCRACVHSLQNYQINIGNDRGNCSYAAKTQVQAKYAEKCYLILTDFNHFGQGMMQVGVGLGGWVVVCPTLRGCVEGVGTRVAYMSHAMHIYPFTRVYTPRYILKVGAACPSSSSLHGIEWRS